MGSKGKSLDDCGIAELAAAVETLSAVIRPGGLTQFSDSDVVVLMRQLETCKRQLAALDSTLILEASDRSLPEQSGAGKLVPFLRHTLGLSAHDASVRVKITRQCAAVHEPTGHLRPAALAVAAEAFEAGAISRDHVRHIVDIMTHLPADIPADARAHAEALLVEKSREGLWPDDLPKIGREILARLDPDGKVINDADRRRKRGIVLGRPGVDGMSWIEGWLTPELRACLDAALAKLARPGMCNIEDVDSPAVGAVVDSDILEAAARRDRRDVGQRNHDALLALLQPDVDFGKLGHHRGMPVQVTLTMSLADLERGAGIATTATGGHMSLNEAMKMADGTRPVLVVFDGDGMPLYMSKARKPLTNPSQERLASPGQRLALIARDRGCTFPDCDAPASMCAAHHVIDWAKGGPTDINNLTLVCDHHHALVNDSAQGWTTVMGDQHSAHPGRVGWIAPKALDPAAAVQVNEKHHLGEGVATSIAARCREWGTRAA
ncbi:HNH endonuclease signature motif containing protein [Nocardia concava]|uniref:HNH endonuclease signature motif containing protein n=1 Tax=Nocardia concava TaxID=257281 RepID=UPI0003198521|nr:HNH endonuclease signature motif containing protein [Nocardia concava]